MKKDRGYYRVKKGRGFTYVNEQAVQIISKPIQHWIQSLTVPPAWSDVWISKDREAYLLATGHDAAERKQYIYHEKWAEIREAKKFIQLLTLGKNLTIMRKRLRADLTQEKLARTRVLAAVVSIIDQTGERIGNTVYADANGSYGITTVRKKHVKGTVVKEFDYTGKSGIHRHVEIKDPAIIKVITACEDTVGYELFKYVDEAGNKQLITSDAVNEYIKVISKTSITAKDFRTWYGTVQALKKCLSLGICDDSALQVIHAKAVYKYAARKLGNTPKIAQESYVHPSILKLHFSQKLQARVMHATTYLSTEEVALLNILQNYK